MAQSAIDERARRPWYKKKRFMIPLAIVVLAVIFALPDEPYGHVDKDSVEQETTIPGP